MAFISDLAEDATLLDVFKAFARTSRPLLDYHEEVLRGPSPLSVANRELIAAYVSGLNVCQYCHGVHSATAEAFGISADALRLMLSDLEAAPIQPALKPILSFVRKLTLTPAQMTKSDAEAVFAAGWSSQALHDAVSVCALFNLMNRLVEGMGLKGTPQYFAVAAKRLSSQTGYRGIIEMLNL